MQVSFGEAVFLNSLKVSMFGDADRGLATVDGITPIQLSSGLVSLGDIYLAAGGVWTISFGAGNGFSVDNTVTAVPEPSTLFLLTTGVFGLICCRRKTRSTRVD